jgi:hypothetical protein
MIKMMLMEVIINIFDDDEVFHDFDDESKMLGIKLIENKIMILIIIEMIMI